MTPNRPDAICLTALRRSGSYSRSTSSPPSPVLRLAADRVHRAGQRLVRLGRDRAVAHRAGREPRDDRLDRLDLVERDRLAVPVELEQAAQRTGLGGELVDRLRVVAEHAVLVRAGRVLQQEHRLRVEQVHLAVAAPLVFATDGRAAARMAGLLGARDRIAYATACRAATSAAIPSRPMPPIRLAVPVKYRAVSSAVEADRLEDLGTAVRRDRRDAHLRHDLQDALAERDHDVVRRRRARRCR